MAITFFAAFATIYVYYPNAYDDSRLIRYVIMARVLRLLRLLFALKYFQVIGGISAEIMPLAANVILLLFCIMYVFAALGMHLFGGMISRDPSNPLSYLVLNTDFSDNDYWANNFNDMISSLNVLFNLLVVNNWTECADGFEAVTQSKCTRLFFLAFHIFGVIVVNNVVIAFIVNSFIAQWDIQHEQVATEEVEGGAVIEGRQALFDATHITGTSTYLTGKYLVRVGQVGGTENQHEVLKDLFTKTESRMSYEEHQTEDAVVSSDST
jgi:two pore calcium channel protein